MQIDSDSITACAGLIGALAAFARALRPYVKDKPSRILSPEKKRANRRKRPPRV
jgi:hypothetical protein